MTGDEVQVPVTIHTVNRKTVKKVEMFPNSSCIHIHLEDGHIVIFDWTDDLYRYVYNLVGDE